MAATCKTTLFLFSTFYLFLLTTAFSEAETLLQFKNSIKDSINSLSTWSNKTVSNHCNWTGISCTKQYVSSITLQSMNLSGEISASVCQLSNLIHLDLADNLFNQPIPLHLSECGKLQALNLSNNLIWGTIPEQISMFKSLEIVDLSRNHIEGKIPESIGLLKQLKVVKFGSNLLSGTVPMVFGNFTDLKILDLSNNPFLVSEIPFSIGGESSNLEQLLLKNSGFYGEIPDFFKGLRNLRILDFSHNNLTGKVPKIESFLPNLVSFDVSQNKLSGFFPNGICEAKGLIVLSLHTNFFNGSISNESVNECLNLERFEVQNNGFNGNFPVSIWSLFRIKLIRAENNVFTGVIPGSISEAVQLEQVQIDNNSFSSEIPESLGKISTLYRFSASANSLFGELPPNFCDSAVMSIINLSRNHLSGKIPEVKNCRKLVSFALADNHFVGEIPQSLSDLPVLTYLDLSQNNLSGLIPRSLEKLKLALFNVSYNQLSGQVPLSLISGLPASFLQGNPSLCGPGLSNLCLDEKAVTNTSNFAKLTIALVFIALALVVFVLSFGFYLLRSHKRKAEFGTWRSVFFYPLRVSEQDLIIAMDEKTTRGKHDNYGRACIVNLPSGELVCVKKIFVLSTCSSKSLKNEIKTLAKIRHKNVVKILGYCRCDDCVLLIYEYLPNGSLGDLIRKPDFNLPWSVRLKIVAGIAQGLAYLHKDYVPRLLHRNLKSNNVLLEGDYCPKLSDFGLDQIIGENAFHSRITLESASSCYLAPEYCYTKKSTEKNDVYSFGVVLLEILTGRQAEERESEEPSLNIVKWVRRKINITNGALEVLDPNILDTSQAQMLRALEIALCCTSVTPEKRPSMCEVVKALDSLYSSSYQGLELE